MTTTLTRARDFIVTHARILERHLFAHEFDGAPAAPALAALAAYRHDSGLYGYGLEPDKRAASPQPMDQAEAAELLARLDPAGLADMLSALPGITAPDGGVPFTLPTVAEAPHAPWWACDGPQPGSVNPTGILLAAFRAHGLTSDWTRAAEEFCWQALPGITADSPHSVQNALAFLHGNPDPRAPAAWEALRDTARACVSLTPNPDGYSFTPLTLCPLPDSPGATFFTAEEIAPHLDALAAAQHDDGGWPINWPAISPAVEAECRARVTLGTLRTLRAYHRL